MTDAISRSRKDTELALNTSTGILVTAKRFLAAILGLQICCMWKALCVVSKYASISGGIIGKGDFNIGVGCSSEQMKRWEKQSHYKEGFRTSNEENGW